MRDSIPSCIRAPPPEALIIMRGRDSVVARSTSLASLSPTTLPMLPMIKEESVTPQATRRARIIPVPVRAASDKPVRFCSDTIRFAYGFLSLKVSGSVGSSPPSHSSNVPGSKSCSILCFAETYQWKPHWGQTLSICSASFRYIVERHPLHLSHNPSGTPLLGRVPGICGPAVMDGCREASC